jgi:hypothetical protein
MKTSKEPQTWTDSLDKLPKLWNMDMRFGTWNVRSLYRAGSLKIVSRELARYKLDLVGVQEVRGEGSGTEPAGEYTFFYGKGNQNHELGTGFFVLTGNVTISFNIIVFYPMSYQDAINISLIFLLVLLMFYYIHYGLACHPCTLFHTLFNMLRQSLLFVYHSL